MLKITGSSVASAFRVDDNKVVGSGGGAGAENGRCLNKKLGIRILQVHWDQQLCYGTSRCHRIHQTI